MGGGYIATCKLNQQIYYPFDIVIIQADFPPIISKRKMQLSVAIFKELKKRHYDLNSEYEQYILLFMPSSQRQTQSGRPCLASMIAS